MKSRARDVALLGVAASAFVLLALALLAPIGAHGGLAEASRVERYVAADVQVETRCDYFDRVGAVTNTRCD
jgi:hypothetical protein